MFVQLLRHPPTRPLAYALGASVAAAALVLQWIIRPWAGSEVPFLFFMPALVFTAATLGRGPAVIVLLCGAVNGLLLRSGGGIAVHDAHDVAALLAYATVASLVVVYGGYLRLTTGRAALAERRLSLAQENTGVGVFELDFQAGTAFVSPSLSQIVGRPELHGPIPLDRWLAALNPDHVEDSKRAIEARIARGDLRYEREQRILLPNGEVRWLLSRVSLDANSSGKVMKARGAAIDITARKTVEEMLQAAIVERERARTAAADNATRFEVALESCAMPFSILSPVRDDAGRIIDFRWTYMNPAAGEALGRPVDELLERRIGEVLPRAWDAAGLFDRYVGVIERGEQCEFEVRSDATDNGGWFNVVAAPLQGAAAVWFANITERKLHVQALQDADRRKDEFLATLAHELRNPLAPIRQGVRIASLGSSTEAQKRWSHGIIERQVQHMSLLLDDLLDVSRIGRGTLLLRRSPESLSAVIGTAIEMARPHIEAKRHALHSELPIAEITLDIDPLRIAQVVGNLLTNAAKYTDHGGRISLRVRREASELSIRIADNGIGLTEDQLAQVFEMFSQMPGAIDKSQGGLGIGLALARGLAELHGGRITAHSAGPGRGTEFVVHLPESCILAGAEPAGRGAAPAIAPRTAGRRILIADDNADAADSLAELLRLEGHEVHVAYDGEQALATFADIQPDAALLDVGMPRMSGLDVVRAIRNQPSGQRATLIAVTGWGQERDRQIALEAGFDHHITKPMQPDQLRSLIERGRSKPHRGAVVTSG